MFVHRSGLQELGDANTLVGRPERASRCTRESIWRWIVGTGLARPRSTAVAASTAETQPPATSARPICVPPGRTESRSGIGMRRSAPKWDAEAGGPWQSEEANRIFGLPESVTALVAISSRKSRPCSAKKSPSTGPARPSFSSLCYLPRSPPANRNRHPTTQHLMTPLSSSLGDSPSVENRSTDDSDSHHTEALTT